MYVYVGRSQFTSTTFAVRYHKRNFMHSMLCIWVSWSSWLLIRSLFFVISNVVVVQLLLLLLLLLSLWLPSVNVCNQGTKNEFRLQFYRKFIHIHAYNVYRDFSASCVVLNGIVVVAIDDVATTTAAAATFTRRKIQHAKRSSIVQLYSFIHSFVRWFVRRFVRSFAGLLAFISHSLSSILYFFCLFGSFSHSFTI